MAYDYDVAVIGLGPAGMAVSIMASEMGLRVLGVEKRALGGECMNVGCIPSKALLRMAHVRHQTTRLADFALSDTGIPQVIRPFSHIAEHLRYIDEKKTTKMFAKVDLKLREGPASFVDDHTLAVGDRSYRAKKLFICTGTRPAVPPIPGLESVDYHTNETIFSLDEIPESLVVLGGGAVGSELAQAFARLGSRVAVVHMDSHLLPYGDADAGEVLQNVFAEEGISVYNSRRIQCVSAINREIVLETDRGETIRGEKLLVAAGRRHDVAALNLEKAGVSHTARGIHVNRALQTTQRHIYAPGDCNGAYLLTHAAMHQGMIALLNATLPGPFRLDYTRYVVPWTVFTDPPVSHVGMLEKDLQARNISYETVESKYADYGAAISENIAVGSVKAYVSRTGRIYGVRIIGEGSGEMINEWGLAIQNRLRIHKIMFLQHSFPSMSFLTKRVSEGWMMNRMKGRFMRRLARWMF